MVFEVSGSFKSASNFSFLKLDLKSYHILDISIQQKRFKTSPENVFNEKSFEVNLVVDERLKIVSWEISGKRRQTERLKQMLCEVMLIVFQSFGLS